MMLKHVILQMIKIRRDTPPHPLPRTNRICTTPRCADTFHISRLAASRQWVGGQAIIEYLMVVAAVIAAILAVRSLLESRATALMTNAVNQLP